MIKCSSLFVNEPCTLLILDWATRGIILFGNPPWEKKPPCLFRNPVCTPEVAPEAGTIAVAICKFSSMSSVEAESSDTIDNVNKCADSDDVDNSIEHGCECT